MDNIPDAILIDPRPISEQEIDHTHEEMYGGMPAAWIEKPQSTWRLPSQRNQGTSYSCLFQSAASAMEQFNKLVDSAAVYQLRKDPTQEGDYLQDVLDILYNKGTVIEAAAPSQNMSDPQLDAIKLPTFLNLTITGYRTIGTITMEAIAEAVQAYGNCILVFSSNTEEWQITPTYLGTPTTFGHAIVACDFSLINGQQRLVARDSAGTFSSPQGYRLITQDFLNKRCRGAAYILGVKTTPIPPSTPSFTPFLSNLWYGMTSPEVGHLQRVLRHLGYFTYPEDTNYYGSLTRAAVLQFQYNNNVVHFGPESLFGAVFGPKSRAVLNALLGGA